MRVFGYINKFIIWKVDKCYGNWPDSQKDMVDAETGTELQ
jgi:hypothetical protein